MADILKVGIRTAKSKGATNSARRNGMVPAVIYARSEETRELLVNEREFGKLLDAIKGRSPMIDIQIGEEPAIKCIIKQIQRQPLSLQLLHIDFQKIHANEKVTINVPIHLVGTPVGLKMGGLLDHALRELPVRGLPADLPTNVSLDITNLKVGQGLHISDVRLDRVEIQLPLTTPIASVLSPKKEEEVAAAVAAPVEGEAPKEPEVISEKKAAERAEERAKAEAEEKGGKAAAKEEKKPEKKEEKKK